MRRLVLTGAILAVASLAGCGGDDDDDEPEATLSPGVTRTVIATSKPDATRTPAPPVTIAAATETPALVGATSTPASAAPTNTPPPPPPPAGPVTLALTAAAIQFSPREFTVAAGSAITIAFTNSDQGLPHNVHVFQGADASSQSAGMTSIAQGTTTQTLDVGVLSVGPHFFRCDVHPAQMSGTIIVQ